MSKTNGSGMERRDFLKVLGAAGASAGVAGCATEPDRLIPYLVQPEEIVPGTATWYRTTCRECPAGCGMTIRTREGRAVKAEGNPASPISHGRLCARGQASMHGLYDPDRVPQALVREGDDWSRLSWDSAEAQLARALSQAGGNAVFLSRPEPGSMDRLLGEWTDAMGIRHVSFDTFGREPIRAAHRMLYGIDALPIPDFTRAEVVVSFGADFMETWGSTVENTHGFVEGHAYANERRGRFISVTPHQSLTDLNADEWLAVRPGTEHLVALAMARLVAESAGRTGVGGVLSDVDPARYAEMAGVPMERIQLAAAAFANDGRSLAVGPGVATTHAAATTLAAAVAVLNDVAGNMGSTVRLGPAQDDRATYADLDRLVEEMAAGRVSVLMVRGPNPLYDLPNTDRVAEALAEVPFIASFSPYLDETSAVAHLLLPDHHFLESWGDYEPRPGVHSLIQPVMTPVFDTKQTGDVLLSVARRASAGVGAGATTYYDYLREQWRGLQGRAGGAGSFDEWWPRALQSGVLVTEEYSAPSSSPAMSGAGVAGSGLGAADLQPPTLAGDGEFSLVVYPSYRFYDGRLANRPWLQELPDPVSKHTWGTVLEMNPRTADELGLDDGSLAEVRTPNGTVELPVWRHPGMREDVVAIQMGQGHERLGRYARDRGVNPIKLLAPEYDAESGALVFIQTTAHVTPTGRWERQPFSSTQQDTGGRHLIEHMSLAEAIEADRGATLTAGAGAAVMAEAGVDPAGHVPDQEEPGSDDEHGAEGDHGPDHPMHAEALQLQESGGFAPVPVGAAPQDYPPPGTHYGEYTESEPRWAMTVDMDRCIGCSACMTACQAENNIGIVGPELVAQGRLIQWMRIERYFDMDEEGEVHGTTFLPMLCQQCGTAPCEPVCPVYASYHTPDGLNAQVYNRCVGTRYCANNCPYKVRYFNYFSYEWPEPLNWQLNPDVTVREKGIMEKCTFCVQRIRDSQHHARLEGRPVRDGEVVPACQQTCPADAIVFGNIKDPNSRVAHMARSGRGFRVFDELNTQSAVVYLQKVAEGAEEAVGH